MDRLQFIHCDNLFKTREEAKAYVTGGDLISITRPALYAEPMVLKYGDESNPNILLAIGSVGDGKTPSINNKVYFIDFAEVKESIESIINDSEGSVEEIKKISELVKTIVKSCGFNEDGSYLQDSSDEILKDAKSLKEADSLLSKAISEKIGEVEDAIKEKTLTVENTPTISHVLTKNDEGQTLKSEIVFAPYRTVKEQNLPNILLRQADGVYTNVRMAYNEEKNELAFGVNDDVKYFALPKEIHLIKGEYDTDTESLILTLNSPTEVESNGKKEFTDKISIDLSKLIGEWTVLGNKSETPIVLTKEAVTSKDVLRGASEYQDILSADIRLADEVYDEARDNILKRYNKNTLYVKGTADNIRYYDANGNVTTVQDALRNAKAKISTRDFNIIVEKEDGIFAKAELAYDKATNSLTFDNGNGLKTIQLNNSGIINYARYDRDTESLIISFRYADGTDKEISIPLHGLIHEWDVENSNHTVSLTKSTHNVAGTDTLSADVNIASGLDNNILKVVGHALYVKGTADNIAYRDGKTVAQVLDNIATESKVDELESLITAESEARKKADDEIKGLIENNSDAIVAEQHRAELAEADLEAKIAAIDDNSEKVEELGKNVEVLKTDFANLKNDNEKAHSEFANNIESLTNQVDVVENDVIKLSADLQAEINRATTAEENLKESISSIKDNSAEVAELQVKVAALDTELKAHEDLSSTAHQQLADKVNSIDGRVTVLESNSSSVSTELTALNKKVDNHIDEANKNFSALTETDKSIRADLGKEIVRAQQAEMDLNKALAAEVTRAKGEEDKLNQSISNVSANLDALSTKVDDVVDGIVSGYNETKAEIKRVEDSLNAEIQRSTNKDTEIEANLVKAGEAIAAEVTRAKEEEAKLQTNIDNNASEINKVSEKVTQVEGNVSKLEGEVANLKAEDARLNIVTSETNSLKLTASKTDSGTTLSGVVKLRQAAENIITLDEQGLYSSVKMEYSPSTNIIKFTVNGVTNEFELSTNSLVQSAYYDSHNKEIVLIVKDEQGETKEIRIPVDDLVNDWKVDNGTQNPIKLNKSLGSDGVDVLTAKLDISTESHNLILNQNGTLYASNQAKDLTALWAGDEITVQKAIENIKAETDKVSGIESDVNDLKDDMSQVKNDIVTIKGDVSNLQIKVEQNTQNIAKNTGAIENLTNQFSQLSTEVTNLSNQFTELETKVETYENRITNLESQVVIANQNISNLTEEINKIKEIIGTQEPSQPSISDRLDEIEKVLASLIDFETYA